MQRDQDMASGAPEWRGDPQDYERALRARLQELDPGNVQLASALAIDNDRLPDSEKDSTDAVVAKAAELSWFAGLEVDYFRHPASTYLLLAIAESWLQNERLAAADKNYNPYVVAEFNMLADTLLVAAGERSAVVRDMRDRNIDGYTKYIAGEADQMVDEREAFFERIRDQVLERQLTDTILTHSGAGSLMREFGGRLRLPGEKLPKITFRVISLGNHIDLNDSGLIPRVAYSASDFLLAAMPYDQNDDEYARKFATTFGMYSPGKCEYDHNGDVIITVTAPVAYAYINFYQSRHDQPSTERNGVHAVDPSYYYRKVVPHELGHALRSMALGHYAQLALMLDEYNAGLIAEEHGYGDAPIFLMHAEFAIGYPIREAIAMADMGPDPLSWLAINAIGRIGLRSFLLLLLATPTEYQNDPHQSGVFVRFDHLALPGDPTPLAALIRGMVAVHGEDQLRQNVHAYVASRAGDPVEAIEKDADAGMQYGLTQAMRYFDEALAARKQQDGL